MIVDTCGFINLLPVRIDRHMLAYLRKKRIMDE